MVDDEIKVIRQVRHEISAEFGHDIDRVVDYYGADATVFRL